MMFKTAAAFLVLLAVCYAQPPPEPIRPKISETFMAQNVTVHRNNRRHGNHMGHGRFERAYDPTNGMEILDIKFMTKEGTYEDQFIVRFDTKMAYNILSDPKTPEKSECNKTDIPSGAEMSQMWDLEGAHGERHEDPRTHEMVDSWSTHLRDGSFQTIFVDDKNVNMPLALIRVDPRHGEEDDIRFNNMFKVTTPPMSDFTPPASCNM